MSLAISTVTPQGIILASDSRQTYRNSKGASRVGTDSVSKIYPIGDRIAVAMTGLAFLPEGGVLKSFGYFINKFVEQYEKTLSEMLLSEIAEKFQVFLLEKYNYKAAQKNMENNIETQLKQQGASDIIFKKPWLGNVTSFYFLDKDGNKRDGRIAIETINFLMCGFEKDSEDYSVFIGSVPGPLGEKRNSQIKGKEFGADWLGQTDVVARIVLGFDPRIESLPFVYNAYQSELTKKDQIRDQLHGLEYVIQWGTMTLQDAIDFSTLAIRTTEAIQRFSDGIAMDLGDIPGVGGDVDVMLITAKEGVRWLKKKELQLKNNED